MLLHPAFTTLFKRTTPLVTVLDVKSDISDLTTYTFTACNLGDLGSTASISGDAYGTNPHVRSSAKKLIIVIAHGEDALATFDVSSITIGGVSGTERADRGGATSAINTALYVWDTNALAGITTTDIVVTWSEAITACAIGVLLLENLGIGQFVNQSSSLGASLNDSPTVSITAVERYCVAIGGSTIDNNTETLQLSSISTTGLGQSQWMELYEQTNAEIGFAAYWSYFPGYPGGNNPFRSNHTWSGASVICDAVTAVFV